MGVIRDVAYRAEHGRRGMLDIWLPDRPQGAPVVVVMHGGGFQALSKERMDNVARLLAQAGYAAVNINYRLLPQHPFPAPIEDGIAACEWVLGGGHPALAEVDGGSLALLGASAGGYMALAVGMLLGRFRVRGIVDISGPVHRRPEAPDSALSVPPIDLASADSPPVLCIHSRNDRLVPPEHSREIVEKLRGFGARAELYLFDGAGEQHGIWREEATSPHLLEELEAVILRFLASLFGGGPTAAGETCRVAG